MNESLRTDNLVAQIPKWVSDSQQNLGPFIIPPNTYFHIVTFALHYNTETWGPDANIYNPSRFLRGGSSSNISDNSDSSTSTSSTTTSSSLNHSKESPTVQKSNWPKHSFAPFSEGPRSCLGKKFAQVEFVCALSMLAQRYTWRLAEDVDPTTVLECHTLLTTKPKKAVRLLFKRR
jgi:cytochrome P450